ncbi:integral membrane protein PTH11 [Fusarium phyllophilum]|uniref:Integral membrane protein PTH11 n=1 Tax=Fusarium phyllophilum TaxID=47803 RepID=A0A8H5MS20_9HYPO|nr:integral membrane protein PTH11 [Fusarium phyllophilum]
MSVPNRGPELQAVCYTLAVSSVIAVALRIYVRVRLVKNFGLDDWFMCSALITFLLFVMSALLGVKHGTGRHRDDLDPHDFQQAMKWWWWCYLWYCLTMISSKISIGYLLLRITTRKLDVWILYGVMAITVCTGVVFFFVTLFQCSPISYFWNQDQPGKCVKPEVIMVFTYLYSVFSVISDFTCAILPMFLVFKLNMGRKTKLALIPIMAMACVLVYPDYYKRRGLTLYRASAAVVVRFPFVKDFKNPDFLWATIDIAIWSTTEQGLAVTAGSLATLRPLLRLLGRKLGITTSGRSELRDTDQQMGSGGFRPTKGTNGSGNKHRDLFSLATFAREDDLDGNGREGQAAYAGEHHFQSRSSAEKGVSAWRSRDNESEEELTGQLGSDNSRIVKVTTFEVRENRI